MPVEYTNDLGSLNSAQLRGFFVGWPKHPDLETHLRILRNSAAVWIAIDGDRCVGFINALSDGVFYAYIPLLEVLPEYQGQGIGTELVRRMVESLQTMYAIDVVCDAPVSPFYEAMGFRRCPVMALRSFGNQSAAQVERVPVEVRDFEAKAE